MSATPGMPTNPLFSSYRTGENRVTGSMLAVFERVGVDVLERILGGALEDLSAVELIRFRNQVVDQRGSVPDASISGSFRFLLEVKTEANVPSVALRDQVERHLKGLNGTHQDERVFVITPDGGRPAGLETFSPEQVAWINFDKLSEAITGVLNDLEEPVSAESAFLLRELRRLFETEGLIGHQDTVIVAAASAYPAYERASAYVCQPDRRFRKGITHLGFYAEGEIKPEVARILHHWGSESPILFTRDNAEALRSSGGVPEAALADVIEAFLDMPQERDREGLEWQVFVLSGRAAKDTVRLTHPIKNTTRTRDGRRPWAWTLAQRYAHLDALRAGPKTTSALDAEGK